MVPYIPKQILVQEQSWQDRATHEILERLPGIPTHTIKNTDSRSADLDGTADLQRHTKDTLILMRFAGNFLKNCQGSGAEICCNYKIVSYAWNCPMECTYCVLQCYLNNNAMVVCTNIEDLLTEVRATLDRSPVRSLRIGTGELTDSLALDSITQYSQRIVPLFATHSNTILELKTKSDQIGNLKDLDHRGRTVVSWSMNSRHICSEEELGAPSFETRLAAAVQCQEWGYKVGFHFDPVIFYEEWETGYREAVRDIFRAVDPGRVAWVSLGALRFTPHLRELVRKRFPKSMIPYGEFVPGHHGKLRYFRPIREEMYRGIRSWIREQAPGVFVYLCMESAAVWQRSFGERPRNAAHLNQRLAVSG